MSVLESKLKRLKAGWQVKLGIDIHVDWAISKLVISNTLSIEV
jgi:hypothetical protein